MRFRSKWEKCKGRCRVLISTFRLKKWGRRCLFVAVDGAIVFGRWKRFVHLNRHSSQAFRGTSIITLIMCLHAFYVSGCSRKWFTPTTHITALEPVIFYCAFVLILSQQIFYDIFQCSYHASKLNTIHSHTTSHNSLSDNVWQSSRFLLGYRSRYILWAATALFGAIPYIKLISASSQFV